MTTRIVKSCFSNLFHLQFVVKICIFRKIKSNGLYFHLSRWHICVNLSTFNQELSRYDKKKSQSKLSILRQPIAHEETCQKEMLEISINIILKLAALYHNT